MHRQLRKGLESATGYSEQVIALFLDVRGFSSFAAIAESTDAAAYLRAAYLRILDEYFPEATFFKPTGDGLMIIQAVERESLRGTVINSIEASLRLTRSFGTISKDDPMINFRVPTLLGIGMARGSATRLASKRLTLDYSGRPLNLAARLMDMARPSGLVVDGSVSSGLVLPTTITSKFNPHEVYVKGINDTSPRAIMATKAVVVPVANRHPLIGEVVEDKLAPISFKELAKLETFIHRTVKPPVDPEAVELRLQYSMSDPRGVRITGRVGTESLKPVRVRQGPNRWEIIFNYAPIVPKLAAKGVKPAWQVRRALRYLALPTRNSGDEN
jgi:class 3 adenylate cyclase